MASGFEASFLGAFQASISILLVLFTGVLASQFQLLDATTGKNISKVCVKMFMPALLITKIGSELHLGTAQRYIPILIWALTYILVSVLIGILAVKLFKLPNWVAPALAFNNTTSLPLLLMQSLGATGILKGLLIGDETASDAIERAKSYFLVCAVVGNCLTFALGPRLIDAEHAPDELDDKGNGISDARRESIIQERRESMPAHTDPNEQTSLLPDFIYDTEIRLERRAYAIGKKRWDTFGPRTQYLLLFAYDFVNAPVIGAIIGCIIGLTPPLHRAFFNESDEGGFFSAWLTSALHNVGGLFVSLQVVVVGVSLSESLRKMKRGEDSGDVPLKATIFVLVTRYAIWPVISIAVIWALATKTNILQDDPVLWFAMMLMPTGPPAMKLVAMADVNGASEAERMSISKLLTISYALAPLLAFTVVGALKASQSAI